MSHYSEQDLALDRLCSEKRLKDFWFKQRIESNIAIAPILHEKVKKEYASEMRPYLSQETLLVLTPHFIEQALPPGFFKMKIEKRLEISIEFVKKLNHAMMEIQHLRYFPA